MSSTVICISASDGAGAEEVASAVGERLGFRVINEEIVARAAAAAGVEPEAVEDVEKRKTTLAKILDLLVLSGAASPEFLVFPDAQLMEGIPGITPGEGAAATRPSEELRGLIRSAIEEFVAEGDVVILAHAASQSLAADQRMVRVLVTASAQTRSARLAESLDIPGKKADALVKSGDAGRADYLKRFYGIEHELPTHYDIVVNTDKLTPDEGAAAIVSLAKPVANAGV